MTTDFTSENEKRFKQFVLKFLSSNMPDDPKDLFEYVEKHT